MTPRVSKPTCMRVGVTNPKTPMGAKEIINFVIERITALRLSQNATCVSRAFGLKRDTKNPKSNPKKINPSSCPSVAALNKFEGTIRWKISTRPCSPLSAWSIAPSILADWLSDALESIFSRTLSSTIPGFIKLTQSNPVQTAKKPVRA